MNFLYVFFLKKSSLSIYLTKTNFCVYMNKTRGFNLKFFFLKKELYFHKIQYSKVLKYDVAAAIFGVVIGAFVVYLSLNTLGSGSPDLSDLSIFV